MTQREQTLNKHAHISDEELRDAIHDAMEEHAGAFAEWASRSDWIYISSEKLWYNNMIPKTTQQLYNEFNLRT